MVEKNKDTGSWVFLFVLAVLVSGICSCSNRYSFGLLSLKKFNHYVVRGEVDGLELDSVILTLVPEYPSDKQQEVEINAPGGYFSFDERVQEGASYYVHLNTNPEVNSCVVKNKKIKITEDMKSIRVTCFSYDYGIRSSIDPTRPSQWAEPAGSAEEIKTKEKKEEEEDAKSSPVTPL